MGGRNNASEKMIYKYGSIVCLVISGLIAFFGSWVRLTSEMTALLRMGGNYIFDEILDYLDTGSLSVYNHLKAGKLTLLDMHKILKGLGYIYEEFDGKNPFKLIGLIPLAAVIILIAVVVAEIVCRLMDKGVVFLTAAVQIILWFFVLGFVFLFNGSSRDNFYNISMLRISFLPILAAALAIVSGVLWNSYRKMGASSPTYQGYNPAGQQPAPGPYNYDSDTIYYGPTSSPGSKNAGFGGAGRQGGPADGMRHCPNCGAPLPPNSKFCGNCGSPVR